MVAEFLLPLSYDSLCEAVKGLEHRPHPVQEGPDYNDFADFEIPCTRWTERMDPVVPEPGRSLPMESQV